jgi:O-antigen ligase
VEKIALFLFLLAIPTQLGRHFWPVWSQVMGIRVDYLSPTLYLVDIFWVLWMGFRFCRKSKLDIKKIVSFENIIFLLLIVVNVMVAGDRGVAIYRWVRIVQWIISLKALIAEKENVKEYLKIIIPIWVIGESLLGLAQVINGGSLGGIWYWIGERRFSFSSIGIAQMSLFGEGMLRAYGSFSHPNSLAGFLLIVWWYWGRNKNKNVIYWIVYWAALLGIGVSGSRWVWGITLLLFLFGEIKRNNWKKVVGRGLLAAGLVLIMLSVISANYEIGDFFVGWDSDSFNKREALFVAGIKMVKESPLLGIGAGNFVYRLPQYQKNSGSFWLQPAHNIFLLGWSEIGILGVILVGLKVGVSKKSKVLKQNWVLMGIVAMTGLMDHYWLTLPQNSWLLAIIFSLL